MISLNNPFSLVGKTILVTGASSGIGKSVAIESSRMGARLIILGRNSNRLLETMSLLLGEGHSLKELDLNNSNEVSDYVNGLSKLDGIVFCAGTQKTTMTRFLLRHEIDEVFETNFFATVNLNQQLLSKKKINKNASLVFISSTASGLVAEYGNAAYSASKGAITAYSKVLALELTSQKTRVNIISPGMIKTPLLSKIDVDENQLLEDEKRYPFGYGNPEDVAFAVIYLLSDASKWVTGSDILLDGGLTLK